MKRLLLLTIRLSGKSQGHDRYAFGYAEKETIYENVIYTNYFLFGWLLIYRKAIFIERIPSYVMFSLGAFGYYDWKSSKPWLINASNQKRVIKNYIL